jgi:hypothetical protein
LLDGIALVELGLLVGVAGRVQTELEKLRIGVVADGQEGACDVRMVLSEVRDALQAPLEESFPYITPVHQHRTLASCTAVALHLGCPYTHTNALRQRA